MGAWPKRKGPSPEELEMARICTLPVEQMLDPEELEVFCYDSLLAEAFEKGERLLTPQATAVKAYQDHGGGLFPIAVGWGKTGISLMVAEQAHQQGVKRSLLLIPIQQLGGLMRRHIPEWRRRVPINVSFHYLAGRPRAARRAIAQAGANGCYVYAYSLLSQSDCVELLDLVKPELVIADEVHLLKNPRSARSKRVITYLRDHGPQFVGMSGTITSKSVKDYHHLISAALGDLSPLPRSYNMAWHWDQIINSAADGPDGPGRKLMLPLMRWAKEQAPEERFDVGQTESFRRAYRHRLTTAPGVVATGDAEIGVSLGICNTPVAQPECCEGWDRREELEKAVIDEFITPNGDDIDHAFHCFKWRYELAAGFYNQLTWPEVEALAARRNVSIREAEGLIAGAKLHHTALQSYHRELREFFKESPPGLDTPREVGRSMSQHGDRYVPTSVYAAWRDVKELDFDGRPDREASAIRVCDYKIQHAVEWAKQLKGRGGLIWVWHQEVGTWVTEALAEAGLDPVHCAAGPKAGRVIESIGDPVQGGKGDRIVVASIGSHGTGRNLQAFQEQLVLQFPRDAKLAEQMIGRTHRNGQEADHLDVTTCITVEHDELVLAAVINDAIYIQQTTGARQKIVFADYDPMPRTFSPEFLREQGIQDIARLDAEQREMVKNLFGMTTEPGTSKTRTRERERERWQARKQPPQSKYAGVSGARVSRDGNYIRGGHYLLLVERIEEGQTFKKQDFVAIQQNVLHVFDDSEPGYDYDRKVEQPLHRVGESVTDMNMLGNVAFESSMKAFALVAGDMTEEELLEREEYPGQMIEEMVSDEQPLAGAIVEVVARTVIKKDSRAKGEENLSNKDIYTRVAYRRVWSDEEAREFLPAEIADRFLPAVESGEED
ncbi:Uncharacterized protein (Fragment) [Durusdinium trenchii]|uniref:Helicase/UvrB N-terminal domain-containing protein n=1 Tax=Durusdinium trenchii TaxID=1381693 RepID=A0ABP0PF87_9DINO